MWVQFYLDNFASVDEAVRFTQTTAFQIISAFHERTKKWINVHLAIEDAKGDAAIIEYTDGKPHIYHDRADTVMTNDPTYDLQLQNLTQYQGLGGDKPLPGTSNPADRFVRAAYYEKNIPDSDTALDRIAAMLSVMQNVSQPYIKFSPERTLWHTVTDLTHKAYYFNATNNMTMLWAQLNKFDLRTGAPIMKLDIDNHPDLVGEVSDKFKAIV